MKVKTNSIVKIIVLFFLGFTLAGCDPCHKFAKKVCECSINEDEKRECLSKIELAARHKNFDKAKNPAICEKALKECTCEKIKSKNFEGCGFFRK